MMVEEIDTVNSGSTYVTAVEAIEDYDSDDLEAGEIVPTIELSDHAEICDLERESTTSECHEKHDEDDEDSQSESTEAPIAVPLGSLMSTGGIANDFNSGSRCFQNRPEFISATVIKPSKRTEFGLSLSALVEGGSGLCISRIKEKGFLFQSEAPFEVGDRVISINNNSCDRLDHKKAAKLLREAPGPVTIVVQNIGGNPMMVESMITKPSPGHRTGIGFSSSEDPAGVHISSIFLNGLFADSLLTEGDEVLSVNSIPCRQLESSAVADIIIAAPQYVTVVAKKFEGNCVVVAYDDAADKAKRWSLKKKQSSPRRRNRLFGPGCQLLFCTILITAMIVLILYVTVAKDLEE